MYLAVSLNTSLNASSVLARGFNLYQMVANARYNNPPAPINKEYTTGCMFPLLNDKLKTKANKPAKHIKKPRKRKMEIKEVKNSSTPKTGVRIQLFCEKKLPMKVIKVISSAENKIPFRIRFALPLTSLGEHQNAPKPIANPISTWSVSAPIEIGSATAIQTKSAR